MYDKKGSTLHDIFTTALEGGINYWAAARKYRWSLNGAGQDEDLTGFEATVVDLEGETYVINADVLDAGLRRAQKAGYLKGSYQARALQGLYFKGSEQADFDATTADIVVQYGLFGELVYG